MGGLRQRGGVAGHTQSGSLEPALAAGPDGVPAYLALRLATLVLGRSKETPGDLLSRTTITRG